VLKKAWDVHKLGFPPELKSAFIVGIISSAIVGLLAISILLRYLRTRSTSVFIVYRILAGLAVIAYVFLNRG
jgi:undecaprenyl-diphosphatase